MEVKESVSIIGKRICVSSIISESFVFEASDLSSHCVSVDMSDEGSVSVKIDGMYESGYSKELTDSHILDSYIEQLHQRLIGAYERISVYYLKMNTKVPKVRSEEYINTLIKKLKCKTYKESPFEIEKPKLSDIESDLRIEAEGEEITEDLEIEKYVASHIEECYNYRLIKWENLRTFHNDVQQIVAKEINEKYQKQYIEEKEHLVEARAGEPIYIKKKIKELEKTLELPFSTDIDFIYNPETGKMEVDFESPTNVMIPQKKVCLSVTGKYEIVRTTQKENTINQTKCILSAMFYIVGSILNITPKIKHVDITNWQIKGQVGRCWLSFDRECFAKLDLQKLNLLEACKGIKHVFDIKDYILQPIRLNIFEYAIKEGHYDDSTLLKYVNRIKAIESRNYKESDVESPKLEERSSAPSINDMDCGYNLSQRPYIDKSFANWCYKLIEYERCSLKLFLTDFGFSLDRAKMFMNQLVYLHFVGEKNSDGQRKVLIQTENELELRLSWLFPNDSWKY